MKKMRKLIAVVLAITVAMTMGIATTGMAFAQDVPTGSTQDASKGQITVSNAAKGETYSIHKLFDATIGEHGEIAYKGTIPDALSDYFEYTSEGSGYVKAKPAAKEEGSDEMSDGLKAALKTWATDSNKTAEAVSDGSALNFNNIAFGYYVVKTTQGDQLVSVDSTNKRVEVIDKNTTTPSAVKKVNGKDEDSASIGETVTYTATFDTANYRGENGDEQVKSYTISDTLPEFLTDVKITGLTIVQSADDKTTYPDVDLKASYTTFTDKKIVIPWVDDNNESLYKNGSVIQLTYTAKITSTVNIDTANTNTVTITPNHDKEGDRPFNEKWSDDAVIKTYGAALKKVDGSNNALKGAEFSAAGLTVEPVSGEPGVYRVVSYDASSTADGTTMTTNNDGKLYIIGLKESVTLKVKEEKAPDGYNKLTGTTNLTPQKLTEAIYETSGERYYDAKGNLVSQSSTTTTTQTVTKNYTDLDPQALPIVNQQGTELPSTGGIGTTIFYILGALLVVGCGIILIARRRMSANN